MNKRPTTIIGVTGGIGSGKSVVSKILTTLGYPVYDSDSRAKLVMSSSDLLKRELIACFGEHIYPQGTLDRAALAAIVFTNPEALLQLNALVHPAVRADFVAWCSEQQASHLFIESAILFEAHFDREVDQTWCVVAPNQCRIERVVVRDCATIEQVEQRMAQQLTDQERMTLATHTIVNDNNTPLLPQLYALLSAK